MKTQPAATSKFPVIEAYRHLIFWMALESAGHFQKARLEIPVGVEVGLE